MRDRRAVARFPPVARQKTRHDAIAASAVPDQHATGTEDSRKFPYHPDVISWIGEESKGREEVEYCIELSSPSYRKLSHVAASVAKPLSSTSRPCDSKQVGRVVQAIHHETGFREQVRMPALPTRNVKNPGTHGKPKNVDEAADFPAVPLRLEYRIVLEKVVGVEVSLPPLFRYFAPRCRTAPRDAGSSLHLCVAGGALCLAVNQKKTGSRYAPNTSSIAALIS